MITATLLILAVAATVALWWRKTGKSARTHPTTGPESKDASTVGTNNDVPTMLIKNTRGDVLYDCNGCLEIKGCIYAALRLGVDLSYADLKSQQLFGLDLRGAKMIGVDFRSADLGMANLAEADLSGSDFSGANLFATQFKGCNLVGAKFLGANLIKANFTSARL